MNWLQRMLAGRYGMDYMNQILMWFGFGLSVLQIFIRWWVLYYLVWAIFFYAIFRMFSRNFSARSRENQWFTGWFEPLMWKISGKTSSLRGKFESWKTERAYKRQQKAAYAFFACPSCKQKIRVPKGRGKLAITCPTCGHVFHKTT